ncbi:MAG TPA: pyruvate, phosphate dikinase [Solirubrobacteraceae bacterium]|nr:pyruvate, phosphate dikinase [Solirubrobacteraceae bacterium]
MGVSNRILVLDGASRPGRDVVGGKGASISEMRALGLPVPPAFVLPIAECRRFHAADERLEPQVWDAVLGGIEYLEGETGRRFGDPASPLLVSVRSGAAVSMPGMMDTILNLGMTDAVERGLAALSGDPGFARETHVRFCAEFGDTVLGADVDPAGDDATADTVRAAVLADTGRPVPADPHEQLRAAILAVFRSWSSRRAIAYRRHWRIAEEGGTAVVVQAMVFGNLGQQSGTGVLFTRDPLSGALSPYGEWLPGGQGEDVVSGTHDPLPLASLAESLPGVHGQLLEAAELLERHHADVLDIEFTVERERLYLLQTRVAKRSPLAAVRFAADLVADGMIDPGVALGRVTPEQVQSVLSPTLRESAATGGATLARGVPACPGVASGTVAHDTAAAEDADGPVVLARPTTSPEDVAAMIAAVGVVTERGGSTSHAAVVTRALGRPSVVGVGDGETAGWAGREVTIDGTAGVVYDGILPTRTTRAGDVPGLADLIAWARERVQITLAAEHPRVLDLDAAGLRLEPERRSDPAALARAMCGAAAISGSVLGSAEGAQAAVRCGVPVIVPLPGQREEVLLLRLAQAGTGDMR